MNDFFQTPPSVFFETRISNYFRRNDEKIGLIILFFCTEQGNVVRHQEESFSSNQKISLVANGTRNIDMQTSRDPAEQEQYKQR